MITETVAVGSNKSSYDLFDVIVNLDYPNNGAKEDDVLCTEENGKHIIKCGYSDFTHYVSYERDKWILGSDLNEEKLENLYNIIIRNVKNNSKILFHCRQGISRSSTVAIYYLSKITGKSTKDVYSYMKRKRSCINPNAHFRKILGLNYVMPKLFD